LVHPDRAAYIWTVQFSPDGSRLFTAGYPSGIVQIWDVASRKEVRRIDTPSGLRSSSDYAQLTPDWKTLYVPVQKRSLKSFERDGKKLHRIEYSGEIRVWDVASGKEQEPLRPAAGSAPTHAKLAPGGRILFGIEQPSFDTDTPTKVVTVVWDLATGKKRKLGDDYEYPSFAPDGKTLVTDVRDYTAKTSVAKVMELATGKDLARLNCPEKDRFFSVRSIAPDGSVVAVYLGGKKGAPLEIWFRDARTLAERGKMLGKGDPESYWAGDSGLFTPDGNWFLAVDGAGNLLVWNVAERKLERSVPLRGERFGRLAISPDGQMLAIGWAPKGDPELEKSEDPQDWPQPRVSLIDLAGKAPPRTLIAPHGSLVALTFSPDGRTLAVGSTGAVHLFDLRK
jgi:WD40 repeat protein